MEMRVEHDVRAAASGPSDRLRIAPTFMANGDSEFQRPGLENVPPGTGRIGSILGGIELNFVLETGDRSIAVDDQSRDSKHIVDNAFGAKNNRKFRLRGRRRNRGPSAFEELGIRRRQKPPYAPVTGNVAFRKADEAGAFGGRRSDSLPGQHNRLLRTCRDLEIGKRNSNGTHSGANHRTICGKPKPFMAEVFKTNAKRMAGLVPRGLQSGTLRPP